MADRASNGSLHERYWARRSPAERLLLCCMRPQLDGEWRARAADVCAGGNVPWTAVLETAVTHQVAPLVYHHLQSCPAAVAAWPREVESALRLEALRNVAAKNVMAQALGRALDELRGFGADVMAIKGTALDLRLWDESWITVSGDIDLLVRQDWGEVGQSARDRIWYMLTERPAIDVACGSHPDLVMNGILPIDFGAIWQDAVRTEFAGRPLSLMAVVDELLCACVQSCRKRYFRLKSLLEIGELVRRHPELDWDRFARRAVAFRCGGIAWTALAATASATGAACPPLAELARMLRVGRLRRSLLEALVVRGSLRRLRDLYRGMRVRGKNVGRSLVLPYASLGAVQALRSLRPLGAQMRRPPRS
jgi:hypothetical protein